MKGTGRGRALAVAGTTALAPISWGTTYIVVTELLPGGRPLLLAAVRVVPAGLALLALAAVRSRHRPPPVRRPDHRWWQTGVLALCNFGVFFPLLAVAVYRLPGGVAAAAGGLQPLLVAGGTLVAGGGRPRGRDLAVGVVAAAGVGLVVIRPGAGLDPVGVLAAVGANLSFAAGVVLTRRFPAAGGDRLAATGRQLLVGGVVLVPLALAVEGAPPPPTAASLAGFAYLSLAATALAFVLWFDGIRRLPAVAPPLLGLAAPITGAAIGWVALGQALSPVQLAGFAVTLGAIAHGATRGASEAPESVAVRLRAVDRGGQLLGCQQAVAVRDELPHLRPVDRVVDHHPHRAGGRRVRLGREVEHAQHRLHGVIRRLADPPDLLAVDEERQPDVEVELLSGETVVQVRAAHRTTSAGKESSSNGSSSSKSSSSTLSRRAKPITIRTTTTALMMVPAMARPLPSWRTGELLIWLMAMIPQMSPAIAGIPHNASPATASTRLAMASPLVPPLGPHWGGGGGGPPG
jgi:probable blue pigment (indigoidine) exporter